MPTFLFAYHGGGMPQTDEERARTATAWTTWYDEMGSAAVDPGNPVGPGRLVHPDGAIDGDPGPDPVTGYSVIEAASLDEAIGIALDCPIRDVGGRIEVLETLEAM